MSNGRGDEPKLQLFQVALGGGNDDVYVNISSGIMSTLATPLSVLTARSITTMSPSKMMYPPA